MQKGLLPAVAAWHAVPTLPVLGRPLIRCGLCPACHALQKQRQLLEWQAARSAGDEAGNLAAAASLERQDSAGSGNEPMEVRYAAVWEVLPV